MTTYADAIAFVAERMASGREPSREEAIRAEAAVEERTRIVADLRSRKWRARRSRNAAPFIAHYIEHGEEARVEPTRNES